MPRYLLELYAPRGQTVAEAAAQAQGVHQNGIRYVRTLLVEEDETCFHVFEASSRDALRQAASRSGFADARITETIEREGSA
jgi:hypothetical protein